jgi:iron complex transport system substrate-binding protein
MIKLTRHSRARIVSLAPNVTSILVALGARPQLVGVSRWCEEVANVGKLPRVGDCWALDVKEVMRLRPSLIIGSVPFKQEAVAKLLAEPTAFLALNPRSLAGIDSDIRLLGQLAERAAAAERLIRKMRRVFAGAARQARRTKTRPRVYCEAWPNPRISSPPWVAELVEIAGGKMALPGGERITDEAVARARPDIIVVAWTATGDQARTDKVFKNPAWKDVPAVLNRRVVVISDELLNTPGPPLMRGAEMLLRAIHPELARRRSARRATREI